MRAGHRRLLLAAATGLLAFWALGLVLLQSGRGDSERSAGARAVVEQERGPLRSAGLPEEIEGARAPAFALDDARGGRLDTASLARRPYLVTFLYTECQDVCPLIAQEIKQGLRRLGPRADEVTALAVSADPGTDTPKAVRAWLKRHRMPANFRYLVGSRPELAPVWKAHYAAPQPHDKAESAHSASVWLVDRQGRWRGKFSGGVPVPPADIAHDLRILLDEPG